MGNAVYTTALPVLLILVSIWAGMLFNNSRFEKLERRMDGFDGKLDGLRNGFEGKLDGLKEAGHKGALEIMKSMVSLHERVAVVESKQK